MTNDKTSYTLIEHDWVDSPAARLLSSAAFRVLINAVRAIKRRDGISKFTPDMQTRSTPFGPSFVASLERKAFYRALEELECKGFISIEKQGLGRPNLISWSWAWTKYTPSPAESSQIKRQAERVRRMDRSVNRTGNHRSHLGTGRAYHTGTSTGTVPVPVPVPEGDVDRPLDGARSLPPNFLHHMDDNPPDPSTSLLPEEGTPPQRGLANRQSASSSGESIAGDFATGVSASLQFQEALFSLNQTHTHNGTSGSPQHRVAHRRLLYATIGEDAESKQIIDFVLDAFRGHEVNAAIRSLLEENAPRHRVLKELRRRCTMVSQKQPKKRGA